MLKDDDMEPQACAQARPHSLTFAWLHKQVREYAKETDSRGPSILERGSLWVGVAMLGGSLLSGGLRYWLSPAAVSWITAGFVLFELIGLGLWLTLQLKRMLPELLRPREFHAAQMDADYEKWLSLVATLRRFPRSDREARLRFVADRRNRMGDRMGVAFGGIQRLGVFPVLVALYLQFRGWQWGDWKAVSDIHLVAGLLIFMMLLFYALGWLLIGIRTRLDTYVDLLEGSLKD